MVKHGVLVKKYLNQFYRGPISIESLVFVQEFKS